LVAIIIITTAGVAISVVGIAIAVVSHASGCPKRFEVNTRWFTVGAGRLVALAHQLRVICNPRL
jgi:hypothetical protein